MHDDSLILSKIWNDSLLVPNDVQTILKAPGLPIVLDDPTRYAIETTLAYISGETFKRSLWKNEVSLEDRKIVEKCFANLVHVIVRTRLVFERPPDLPAEWAEAMVAWCQRGPVNQTRGPKVIEIDSFIFPLLLAFYAIVYDRAPSNTAGGPTERFIAEFFKRCNTVSRTGTWLEQSIATRSDPSKGIPHATGDRIRQRIRDFKSIARARENRMKVLIEILTGVVETNE